MLSHKKLTINQSPWENVSKSAFFIVLEQSSSIKSPTKNHYKSPNKGESLNDFNRNPISPSNQQKISNPVLNNTIATPLSTNKKRKLDGVEYINAPKVSSYYPGELKRKVLFYCLDSN